MQTLKQIHNRSELLYTQIIKQKETGVVIIVSDKLDIKPNNLEDIENHYNLINIAIYQEDIIF